MIRRLLTRNTLVLCAALVVLLLAGSAVMRFLGAQRAAGAVAIAEGDRLAMELSDALRRVSPDRREGALKGVVERESSLVYAAVIGPDDRPVVEVGPSAGRPPHAPPGMPRFTRDGVWFEVGRPPPGAPPRPAGAPPRLRLRFDAGEAAPVRSAGALDLAIGLTSGTVLLGLAIALWFADRRRERAEVAAAEQAHLASLGEMSAVLAHEIRNPLAALKGHAQLLEERLRSHEGHGSAVRVVSGAQRLESLVNDLLRFAQNQEIVRVEVDPAELAYAALCRIAPDRIELFADEAPDRVRLDPARMGQVLDNLLGNAVQASPEGSQVELHVMAGPSRGLRIAVRDHGAGIPAEVRARIFEPFVTTRTQGTGLGLAVAARLVHRHGGTLTVEEAPGGGARFLIDLPESARVPHPGR